MNVKTLYRAVAAFMITVLVLVALPITSASAAPNAALSQPGAWTQLYAATAFPAAAMTYTVPAGTNRLMVVAISSTRTAAGTQNVSVSYGGQALTLAAGDASKATPNHTYLYYLKEAGIAAATDTNLTVSFTSSGFSYYNWIYAATFAATDQAATYNTTSANYNSGTSTVNTAVGPFSPTLAIADGDQAIEIVNLARNTNGTTAPSITAWATGWTTAGVQPASITTNGPTATMYIRNRNILTAANDGSQHTSDGNVNTLDSMTAMSIKPVPTYTVTFESQGGSAVDSQIVEHAGLVSEPTDPTRTGYTFDGWYDASSGGNLWDFANNTITSTTSIYAYWTIDTYTVSFDSQGGSAVTSQDVDYGNLVTEPTDPTRTGYHLDGWYDAPSGGNLWDFANDTVPDNNMTLYAYWTIDTYTVTFDSQGGSAVASQDVDYDNLATEPTAPTRLGYTFSGWYDAPSGGNQWDFANDTVLGNMSLYAYWSINTYTATFISVASQDGWVLESTASSGRGGSKNNRSKVFYVGDDAGNKQYVGILSFNTLGIPAGAKITKVTLKVKKAGIVGTNPFKSHRGLRVDIKNPKFGTKTALQTTDFQSKASAQLVGRFGNKASAGWYTAELSSATYLLINTGGTTQFRLRFYRDDNNDSGADYFKFYSGNAPAGSQPQLIIEYQIP